MYESKWPFYSFLSVCGPGAVGVKCWDRLCILGRSPRTKEDLPDFHEWYRVTRHPRIFRGLTGCHRDPGNGASQFIALYTDYDPFMRKNHLLYNLGS